VIRGQGKVNTNQIQSAWRTPTENYMSEGGGYDCSALTRERVKG